MQIGKYSEIYILAKAVFFYEIFQILQKQNFNKFIKISYIQSLNLLYNVRYFFYKKIKKHKNTSCFFLLKISNNTLEFKTNKTS
jgi:uncharacterized membrane protein YwzB